MKKEKLDKGVWVIMGKTRSIIGMVGNEEGRGRKED